VHFSTSQSARPPFKVPDETIPERMKSLPRPYFHYSHFEYRYTLPLSNLYMFACSKYAPEDEVTRPLDNNFRMNLGQCYYLLYTLEEVNGDCNRHPKLPKSGFSTFIHMHRCKGPRQHRPIHYGRNDHSSEFQNI
jgi:hypothetical protein